jgi:hypothetical protein
VDYCGQSIRIFPNILKSAGANRMQTVNFGPDDELWVTRSADRKIFILSPPAREGGRWSLSGSVLIPRVSYNAVFVHSAKLSLFGHLLTVIESDAGLDHWGINEYDVRGRRVKFIRYVHDVSPHVHGLVLRSQSDHYFMVTDCISRKCGVLLDDRVILDGIYGMGLCVIGNGDIIVSKYGQNTPGPFNGEPGQLIYIPGKLLTI